MKKILMFLLVAVVGYVAYFFMVLKPLSQEASQELQSLQRPSEAPSAALQPSQNKSNVVGEALKSMKLLPEVDREKPGTQSKTNAPTNVNPTQASASTLAMTHYRGMGFPSQSALMFPPNPPGNGLIHIDNLYSSADLILEIRAGESIIGAAFVKKGEKFTLEKLPSEAVSFIIHDTGNGLITTTRAFSTQQQMKVTPYYGGAGTPMLFYRAEAQLR